MTPKWLKIHCCKVIFTLFPSRKITKCAGSSDEYYLSYWFNLSVGRTGLKTSPTDGDVQVQFANRCPRQNASAVSDDWTCICLEGSRIEAKYDLVHNLESLLAGKQKGKYIAGPFRDIMLRLPVYLPCQDLYTQKMKGPIRIRLKT